MKCQNPSRADRLGMGSVFLMAATPKEPYITEKQTSEDIINKPKSIKTQGNTTKIFVLIQEKTAKNGPLTSGNKKTVKKAHGQLSQFKLLFVYL